MNREEKDVLLFSDQIFLESSDLGMLFSEGYTPEQGVQVTTPIAELDQMKFVFEILPQQQCKEHQQRVHETAYYVGFTPTL